MAPTTTLYLSASEAAAELGVSRATLYAYVSRGKIRSVARTGTRARLYLAEDVRALATRQPIDAAADAAELARPVLDSAITWIGERSLYYRGRDALRLAGAQSLEATATLLWSASEDPFASAAPAPAPGLLRALEHGALRAVDRAAIALASTAPHDALAHNATRAGLCETGARIVRHVVGAVLGVAPSAEPAHTALANGFGVGAAEAGWLRAALVLSADHELNASTLAVRVVASTRASLYRAVSAGIAALSGPEHGGMTDRAGALLAELLAAGDPGAAVRDRLRRGDALPGFGHPLYPKGDPRARVLLRVLARDGDGRADSAALRSLLRSVRTYAGLHPTLDLALSFLCARLGLPPGSALGLFAVGRSVGWIAHALEQYESPAMIRPRARYVGEHPD